MKTISLRMTVRFILNLVLLSIIVWVFYSGNRPFDRNLFIMIFSVYQLVACPATLLYILLRWMKMVSTSGGRAGLFLFSWQIWLLVADMYLMTAQWQKIFFVFLFLNLILLAALCIDLVLFKFDNN